ncbi:GAF domain-containing protein [Alsobacter sp. KACC 23698]|uniref:GAF domain-containing protein n=1 Tax=Alsobacter sp. KACC 23698 TaxID=3149229 RepID=A0AAU7JMI4_9HYPH
MFSVPANEQARLTALAALEILDTGSSPAFERICQIAQEHFHVPMVIVGFMDRDRVWMKAARGLAPSSVPRGNTFCSETIMNDEVLVICDTLRDPRWSRSPFVQNHPHVRFYAGAPIIFSCGVRLGTVCLLDTKPRPFSKADALVLKNLADIAVSELRLLKAGRVAREMLSEKAFCA